MKKHSKLLVAATFICFAACNNPSTNTVTPTATDTMPANSEGMTKTTTSTTTTTQVTLHPIANFEHRTFYNVKTHKVVKLRIDTVNHYYMDVNSNSRPDYFYYDPIAHDTFDYQGRLVNHALIMDNGNYTLDENLLSNSNMNTGGTMDTSGSNSQTSSGAQGNSKIKQKDDMYKEKTDNSKIKITDKGVKIKTK